MRRALPAWPGVRAGVRLDGPRAPATRERPTAPWSAVAVTGVPAPALEFACALIDACRASVRPAVALVDDAGDAARYAAIEARLRGAGAVGVVRASAAAPWQPELAAAAAGGASVVVALGAALCESYAPLLSVWLGPCTPGAASASGVDLHLTRPSEHVARAVAAWIAESSLGSAAPAPGLSAP